MGVSKICHKYILDCLKVYISFGFSCHYALCMHNLLQTTFSGLKGFSLLDELAETSRPFLKISGSESFTRWLVGVGYKSKYESIQSFHMAEYESTALKEIC